MRVWATTRSSTADRALELGDEGAGLARGSRAGPAQRPAGVSGHDLGVFDARLGDGGQLAGQDEHLVFGLAAAPAQPGRDLMGASAHRSGAVPKAGAPGQTEHLEGAHSLGELGHPFGEQTRVGRIGHVGRDDRGVGADFVELDHVGGHGLLEQRLVQLVDGPSPQRVVIFISVLGCGTASVMAMRQKRRQANESVTSAQSVSKPSRYLKRKNIMRR